jgi:2OG-Fe(II) oxygenase superfamily
MIRFERLEMEASALSEQFNRASPFSFVVIDDFCEPQKLHALLAAIPSPEDGTINKSRDRFKAALQTIVSAPVWIDPAFHGGGIHQGGDGSFLDMHVDFSHHPMHGDWERDLNILLYLNPDWKPEYGGQLDLRHIETGETTKVEPLFNRCVIMHTKAYTLHGYGRLNFPKGAFRRSIATYAYIRAKDNAAGRSTVWFPENSSAFKRALGKNWPKMVALKSHLFGSATSRNK